jgi:hypothetical protein
MSFNFSCTVAAAPKRSCIIYAAEKPDKPNRRIPAGKLKRCIERATMNIDRKAAGVK